MPLRDHFRPPLDDLTSWEGFHGQWPAMIVLALVASCRPVTSPPPAFTPVRSWKSTSRPMKRTIPNLPLRAPTTGTRAEWRRPCGRRRGRRLLLLPTCSTWTSMRYTSTTPSAAVASWPPLRSSAPPTRIGRNTAGPSSPSVRPFSSNLCPSQSSILVTTRNFNLYHDLLEVIGQAVPSPEPEPPPLYAAACRGTKKDDSRLVETWRRNSSWAVRCRRCPCGWPTTSPCRSNWKNVTRKPAASSAFRKLRPAGLYFLPVACAVRSNPSRGQAVPVRALAVPFFPIGPYSYYNSRAG